MHLLCAGHYKGVASDWKYEEEQVGEQRGFSKCLKWQFFVMDGLIIFHWLFWWVLKLLSGRSS